ncbi:hypothetical protein Tco_0739559 [Tanacetum coccineum]
MSQLYYYIPFRGEESSSRPSVDTSKATHILRRRNLLHFSLSTISASTHLRNLYISKKNPSQCRYQVYTLGSSTLPFLTSTPTTLVYENERNLKFIDAFDVKPIGGDGPKSLLQGDLGEVVEVVVMVKVVKEYQECLGGFDSNEEEVVPKVDDVSLVNGVFDGAFGREGEEDFVIGEDVVVVRGGSLGGIRRSGTKVKKMIMKMVKMVRMKTIYLGGSGLKK